MGSNNSEMPAIGPMLDRYMNEWRISRAECARRMGVSPSQVSKLLRNYSIQMDTFWKFCIALEHDFFSELQQQMPTYKAPEEDPRIREMQMQIDIYKDLLKR